MAASDENELPLNEITGIEVTTGAKPIETDDTTPARKTAPTGTLIEETAADRIKTVTANEYADTHDADGIDAEDDDRADASERDNPDAGEDFPSAPIRAGEFLVRLSRLGDWQHHPKRGSRLIGAHAAALRLSAADPTVLRPIVVLPAVDGIHPIVDGRFLWAAIKEAHKGNEDIEVRCILFDGGESEAVAAVCDATLGTIGASAIEQAQALLSLTQTNGIGRTAIANRYAGLTVSKVSNMLIAAETKAAYPALFEILHEPDRAPISYGVELNKFRKAMGAAFSAVLDRAVDLAANNERCKPAEALDALQVERVTDADAALPVVTKARPVVPIASEPIFGHDDAPVAAYERLADNVDRIRLPDVSEMSPAEREAAAEACIAQIRRHFGLDVQG